MDNHHAHFAGSQISCGVLQMYNLGSDPGKILYALATNLYHPSRGTPYAFVMWSDTKESNGQKLADEIDEEFGFLQQSEWVENPKTANEISIWTWMIPHETFKEWYIQQRVEKARKL